MAKSLTQLTVFISHTSELSAEVEVIKKATEEIEENLQREKGISLKIVHWNDFFPGVNVTGQAEINRQINGRYDIYIGILGGRFGTPTQIAGSGTEEEFTHALSQFISNSSSVRVLFYFKTQLDTSRIDIEQLAKVLKFKEDIAKKGALYKEFLDTKSLYSIIKKDLTNLISRDWNDGQWIEIDLTSVKSNKFTEDIVQDEEEIDQPGLYDILTSAEEFSKGTVAAIERILNSIVDFGETIKARSQQNTESTVASFSATQKKSFINKIAGDILKCNNQIEPDVAYIDTGLTQIFDAVESAEYESARLNSSDEEKFQATSLKDEFIELRLAMQSAQSVIQEIRSAIQPIPSLTSEFGFAKNKFTKTLNLFEASVIAAINRINNLGKLNE